MTTVQQLIDRIRRDYLTQGRVEPRNKLASSVTDSDTTFTFTYDLDNIVAGSIISIGLEDCYVWSTDTTAKSAVVDRGVDGTTAASHTTTDRVRVTPRWTDAQILRAINSELDNLYAQGLYGVDTDTFEYSPATVGYEIDASAVSIWQVQAKDYAFDNWVRLSGWEFRVAQDTSVFASGKALYLRDGAYPGQPVLVGYRRPFEHLTSLSSTVASTSLLADTSEDVLALGTAIGLLVGRAVSQRLLESQGSTRRSDEVPPGSLEQSITPIIRQYQARVRAERATLTRKYGL